MIILGIESSCDETSVAIVTDERKIISNKILSQIKKHQPFGGVVPEVAARAHLEHLDQLIRESLSESEMGLEDIDGIAVAGGPGLIGGVIVGVTTAKAIAAARSLPFVAVNHLEAHALTARLTNDISFPYLLLLVSGGHCQLLVVEAVGRYKRLGSTIDDAVGEAFDKAAKLLGLAYPGGPSIEKAAQNGNARRFDLPRPLRGRDGCDFSFSGLKTALLHTANGLGDLSEQDVSDLAAVSDIMKERTERAIRIFQSEYGNGGTLVMAGGVAANQELRQRLSGLAERSGMGFAVPPVALCTDNGAMIAWAGIERLRLGMTSDLDFAPRPRWPLDEGAQRMLGGKA